MREPTYFQEKLLSETTIQPKYKLDVSYRKTVSGIPGVEITEGFPQQQFSVPFKESELETELKKVVSKQLQSEDYRPYLAHGVLDSVRVKSDLSYEDNTEQKQKLKFEAYWIRGMAINDIFVDAPKKYKALDLEPPTEIN